MTTDTTGTTGVEQAADSLEQANTDIVSSYIDSTVLPEYNRLKGVQMDRYGFGAWSVSKLKVLQKCPLQFFLKYVLKIKVPKHIGGRQETLSADVGTAAHRILELVLTGLDLNKAIAATHKEFVPGKLTESQWEEHVSTLTYSINAFKERIEDFNRRHPIKRIFTEISASVTRDWEPTGFFSKNSYFRGIIDLCLQLEDGSLVIIDHKTGGDEMPMGIRPFEFQLNSYKPLFHYGVQPIEGAQSFVHFIRASDVKSGDYHDADEIENKLKRAIEWEMDGAVDTVSEMGFFKHIAGSHCKWCDYHNLCKTEDKLLKPLELSTKKLVQASPG
jgi:hypothetical protein